MRTQSPLVIAFISDAEIADQIEQATRSLQFEFQAINSAEKFGPPSQDKRPGEPVDSGQTANLVRYLTEQLAGLLIFDADDDNFPWRHWIQIIKSSPATRRTSVLVLAENEADRQVSALASGADSVVAKATFAAQAQAIIAKQTRKIDLAAIDKACHSELSALGHEGIALFNRGDYYEAHEKLEDAWNADKSVGRDFYKAILQVAVAYLQIERANYRGATKMFLRVRQWLNPLPDVCHGVNIGQLRRDMNEVSDLVQSVGAEKITSIDRSIFRPIQLIDSNLMERQ